MKSSIIKKIEGLVKESEDFRKEEDFSRAISKIKQALDFVKLKAKESEERDEEVKKLTQTLDQIYAEQITYLTRSNIEIINKNDFDSALANLEEAKSLSYQIKDLDLQEIEKNKINDLTEEIGIRKTLSTGKSLVQSGEHEKALEIYKLALNEALKLYQSEENEFIIAIKSESDIVNSSFIDKQIGETHSILNQGENETAIEKLNKIVKQCEKFYDKSFRDEKIGQIQTDIDKIYISIIEELVNSANEFLRDKDYIKVSEVLNGALRKSESINNAEVKLQERQKITTLYDTEVLPFYQEKLKPLIENGKRLKTDEKFQTTRTMFDEAVNSFQEALKLASEMIEYDKKEQIITEIVELLDATCKDNIKPHTDESLRYVNEKNYDKAISELYSALSIAKSMACGEDDNEEIENIKDMINGVYLKEIEGIISEAGKLLEEKHYEEAIEKYNQGLSTTNKMYLSNEMEKEVSRIKELIYEVELEQIVDKGEVVDQENQYDQEIAKLKKSLERAKRIEDSKLKEEEILKIKTSIDQVHSTEIELYLEQCNDKVEHNKFDEGYDLILKAYNIVELMESPLLYHKEKEKVLYELINLATALYNRKKYKKSIEVTSKIIEINDEFVEAYYKTGLNFLYLKDFEKAIDYFKMTVDIDSNHAEAWNYLGYSYNKLEDQKSAIDSYSKALEINPKFPMALYNMANIYFSKAEYLKSIKYYERVVETESGFAEAWFFMGSAYIFNNNYNVGINYIEKTIELKKELGKEISSLIDKFKEVQSSIKDTINKKFEENSDIL